MANLENSLLKFTSKVEESENIVASVEALWQTAPLKSQVRAQINEGQLDALYEMAYLSLFGHWENFVEDCTVRMLAGQGSRTYSPVINGASRARTLTEARARVLGNRPYLLWYDPTKSADRVKRHVTNSPLEAVLRAESSAIEEMAAIRHAIAHQSQDAFVKFKTASLSIVGIEHGKPGELLRSQDHTDPLNPTRWLRRFTDDLRGFALQSTT